MISELSNEYIICTLYSFHILIFSITKMKSVSREPKAEKRANSISSFVALGTWQPANWGTRYLGPTQRVGPGASPAGGDALL